MEAPILVTQFILRYVMRGIRFKKKSMKKYCITFMQYEDGVKSVVMLAYDLKLEDAVQFALNLHRSSNCLHTIAVYPVGVIIADSVPVVAFVSEE